MTLIFFPPICDGYDPLTADVIFTDNYEAQHVVKQVRFRPIKPAPATLDAKPILDPGAHG